MHHRNEYDTTIFHILFCPKSRRTFSRLLGWKITVTLLSCLPPGTLSGTRTDLAFTSHPTIACYLTLQLQKSTVKEFGSWFNELDVNSATWIRFRIIRLSIIYTLWRSALGGIPIQKLSFPHATLLNFGSQSFRNLSLRSVCAVNHFAWIISQQSHPRCRVSVLGLPLSWLVDKAFELRAHNRIDS